MSNQVCTNCKAEIPDAAPPGQPCPTCGSTLRTVRVVATSQGRATASARGIGIPYSETLLAKARELIDKGDFNIAIVVAHMACEIQAERVMSQAFKNKRIEDLEQPVLAFLPGYNLANQRIRDLFVAVTGKEIQTQPFWQGFKASAERRNKVVHKGRQATKAEAEDSHKVASDLIAFLKQALLFEP